MAGRAAHHLSARRRLAGLRWNLALLLPLMRAPMTHLAVVLPALNEEHHLERCVRTLIDDPWPRERLEILVVDGGSRDGTLEVARRLSAEFPFLRVLENPKRLQASAFNLALT